MSVNRTDREAGAYPRSLGTVLSATGATAGANGADQTNTQHRGVKLHITITTLTGTTPTLTFTLQGKTAAGNYYTLLVSAALAATGTTVLALYPGLTAAANLVANDVLPAAWRVISTGGGTITNATYTVEAVGLV